MIRYAEAFVCCDICENGIAVSLNESEDGKTFVLPSSESLQEELANEYDGVWVIGKDFIHCPECARDIGGDDYEEKIQDYTHKAFG